MQRREEVDGRFPQLEEGKQKGRTEQWNGQVISSNVINLSEKNKKNHGAIGDAVTKHRLKNGLDASVIMHALQQIAGGQGGNEMEPKKKKIGYNFNK